MTRAFDGRPVDPGVVDGLLALARRAPAAGNTDGLDWVVLEGEATGRIWDVTLPAERRGGFGHPELLDAPVVLLPVVDRGAYFARYAEPDKARSGLANEDRWPVPYWSMDGAMAVMILLLAAEDAGLGALWFGVFRDGDALAASLGIPPDRQVLGAVALGYRAARPGRPGRSASRARRPLAATIHRGGW
jgi:nitroreductase